MALDFSGISIQRGDGCWIGRFQAMASPCLLLSEEPNPERVRALTELAASEAWRIEQKYSRYLADSVVSTLNRNAGSGPVSLDAESRSLFDYAERCYQLSGGLFDITSGVLRQVWRFNGGGEIPTHDQIQPLLQRIGWQQVTLTPDTIMLPQGFEIDFGGIGKEYAVDRAALLLEPESTHSLLLNFGGDLYASATRCNGQPWVIGVDDPEQTGSRNLIELRVARGALATSGDARRYLISAGKRYGHILNPRTGWPIVGAPRSVTVAADNCMMAGMLATFAMLHGDQAEDFLVDQGEIQYWIVN